MGEKTDRETDREGMKERERRSGKEGGKEGRNEGRRESKNAAVTKFSRDVRRRYTHSNSNSFLHKAVTA